ncbi:hypothetical protein KCP69_12390 [Salmonella enterica subsp. enterica]|nr:hypothetical protein KCP69_12390 [Salmonella enterica subsp. enterica]
MLVSPARHWFGKINCYPPDQNCANVRRVTGLRWPPVAPRLNIVQQRKTRSCCWQCRPEAHRPARSRCSLPCLI